MHGKICMKQKLNNQILVICIEAKYEEECNSIHGVKEMKKQIKSEGAIAVLKNK